MKIKILILIIVSVILTGIVFAGLMKAARMKGDVPDTVLEARHDEKDITGSDKILE